MLASVLFYQRHQRLNEIFGYATELPSAGLPVLVCGDLYQLPSVKETPIYCNTDNMRRFFSLKLWRGFKIVELTEVMSQERDYEFILLLIKFELESLMMKW